MKKPFILSLLLLLPFLASSAERQVHIVYLGEHSIAGEKSLHEIEGTHHSYLLSVKKTEEAAKTSLIYSYKNCINGFAAMLTPDEASRLSEMEGVTDVVKSQPGKYSLHTTRSWEFAGLEEGKGGSSDSKRLRKRKADVLAKARYGRDVVVGVLDSGVWPESKSFSDHGMKPVPHSWKGVCQTGDAFNSSHCNRKLIGARYYLKAYEAYYGPLNRTIDYLSPRDKDGHGTHTASTVGGRRVPNTSTLGGFALGTASGGASHARLAIYKVCWPIPGQPKVNGNTCFEEDMLAAIDDAIADGVHVISMSIGTDQPIPYTSDGIAIGSLQALKHNIVVVCSAGNSGPTPATLSNPAPWIMTVGASSIDRTFIAPVVLGNGEKIEGQTVTSYKLKNEHPLVYAGDVVNEHVPKTYIAGQCLPHSLSPAKVKGKIVLCLRGNGTRAEKGMEAKRAGAAGFILGNAPANGNEISVDPHVLPATAVVSDDAIKILQYINSTKKPTATIIPGKTVLNSKPAPFMAAFTSRGPNVIDPKILKPDITAPGLNILAAWTEGDSPTKLADDHRIVKYNFLSGTSMSCPHVSGAAALLRALHPKWSSAAIRSALMTTAGVRNNEGMPLTDASGNPGDSFQYGAGHFRPTKAVDPGLVYDASYNDYLLYLCSVGVQKIDPNFKCSKKKHAQHTLNYPSLAIPQLNGTVTVKRTVTNVGAAQSVYFMSVKPPVGFSVKVSPSILYFKHVGQKKSFTITVKAREEALAGGEDKHEYKFGWYTWNDGVHLVRSPMAVSLG
ncbi:subtilisin-like protease SBT5.6 [Malania oleifera]|uniref:subtilisin-like protease SBT5.6 n=1 Tax=Malania oleifera TaxID=397392 RepID=UPI0025AE62A9|nr:subtilisin-like protease SBT5.6 [Malania oleifera]XP_057948458.1 subtilisin-like protease SBT5.6 [Malania oleifera]XP_057948459.1 subtilisin-like protease SBT5.6 [Malania oleifera]